MDPIYSRASNATDAEKGDGILITVRLVYRNGDRRGERIAVTGAEFLIGRHPGCDLPLGGNKVSRRHCLITQSAEGVTIQDLRSRNGTYVSGRKLKVNEKFRLSHRDKVQVGDWRFRVSLRDAKTGEPIVDQSNPSGEVADGPTGASAEDLIRELDALTTELEFAKPPHDVKWRTLDKGSDGPPSGAAQPNAGANETLANDPSTVNQTPDSKGGDHETTVMDAPPAVDDSDGAEEDSKGPQKLPEHLRPKGPSDSKDAASIALRRHFGM